MVGQNRPVFVLFGSSIVVQSFAIGGWGAMLADAYACKPHPSGLGAHVPIPEYIENIRRIASHLKSLSEKICIIFLSCLPINKQKLSQIRRPVLKDLIRTNESSRQYSEACVQICKEMKVKSINLWNAIQKRDWCCLLFGVSKGLAVEKLLRTLINDGRPQDFLMCIGDDRSDEDMFDSINSTASSSLFSVNPEVFACTVGQKPSKARYYVNDTMEVLVLLIGIADSSTQKNKDFEKQVSFEGSIGSHDFSFATA